MQVIHFSKTNNVFDSVTTSIQASGLEYVRVKEEELLFKYAESEKASIIVIEDLDIGILRCIGLIKEIKRKSPVKHPVIYLAENYNFEFKSLFFSLGVMTYIDKRHFNAERFMDYLITLSRESEVMEMLQNLKIAIVDDSLFSLEILKGYCSAIGLAQVDYYTDSRGFLENSANYDMVIVDLVMPDLDGEDLIYHIRKSNPKTIILLMTAYSESRTIPHCLSIGANDFILKPLDFNMFVLRVTNSLKHHLLEEERSCYQKELYYKATRDGLTGAYNRQYLIEQFNLEWQSFSRYQDPLSLILVDLDRFKGINDEYGHSKGDAVLINTVTILQENLRFTDMICRWGGEEFVILLRKTGMEEARIIAEKLRHAVMNFNFGLRDAVTASFGVVEVREEEDREDLFRRLDNSLYLAKLTGRNKIVANEEISIVKSGLPVNIEWGPFFRSGNPEVDQDHEVLIALSNDIIINCFSKKADSVIKDKFSRLVQEIVEHFKREEKVLEEYCYAYIDEHRGIHKNLVEQALCFQSKLLTGKTCPVDVAKFLIQEVVVGHIIKNDFEFFGIFEQ